MAEVEQVQSDAEQVDQSTTEQPEQITVNRTAEELARRLKEVSLEAKQNRQKNAELKKQLEEREKSKLADQGQFKELADIWQRKATDSEAKATKLQQAFAVKTIADTLSLEAQKMGCIDTEALVNLIQLDQVPIDDTFNVDKNSVRAMLEDFKKTKPYFFQKQAPKIADAMPAKQQASASNDLGKMTLAERAALLSQLKKQGK
jgi:hypothetical protein